MRPTRICTASRARTRVKTPSKGTAGISLQLSSAYSNPLEIDNVRYVTILSC